MLMVAFFFVPLKLTNTLFLISFTPLNMNNESGLFRKLEGDQPYNGFQFTRYFRSRVTND